MRTFSIVLTAVVAGGLALGIGPSLPSDGIATLKTTKTMQTASDAFRSGAQALKQGDKEKAVTALEYAAAQGHVMALWKLGRMYADGDGVPRADIKAFRYFRKYADARADVSPETPEAYYVANAFVALGGYYLHGISDALKPDPHHAREIYAYAASYFSDADAQYNLAKLYLNGTGAPKDIRQGVRWLVLAANKGQYQAQALLGRILFKGEQVPRQPARGLMWLTLASDGASSQETWINELHDNAFKEASDEERARALSMLERWMRNRGD
jgi:TPR repeat protein